jgi:adenosylhomocysteine nucleosidase
METVALLAAMRMEIRPFLRRVGPNRRDWVGRFPCFRFELCGRECILMETGVGMARAADGSRALLSLFRPALVVSFGIAGASREGLSVGDVVAARDVRRLEAGRTGPALPLPALSEAVFRAVAESLRSAGSRLSWGSIITTGGEQTFVADGSAMENPVLEMETAGIAHACSEAGVPLLALRAISDSVDQPLPFNLADYLDERHQLLIGKLLGAALRHPRLLPALLRLGRNAGLAAENAAAATIAALREHLRG